MTILRERAKPEFIEKLSHSYAPGKTEYASIMTESVEIIEHKALKKLFYFIL
jgi:hypothetical protein